MDKEFLSDLVKAALLYGSGLEKSAARENATALLVSEANAVAASGTRGDKEMPLKSVFSLVGESSKDFFYPPAELTELPVYPNISAPKIIPAEYENLKKALKEGINEGLSCDSLLELLEDTQSYAASDIDNGDISLFDQAKMTAAIASCLAYREDADKPYLLVSGDISGIQDFIYTVASKKALCSLRGRSFYLDFMLEHIAQEILDSIGLFRCNLLYTGGGHFYILAPNTSKVREKLESAHRDINRWFIKNFGAALYLAMDYVEASSGILRNGVRELFKGVSEKLSRRKSARYGKEELFELTAPKSYENARECVVCGDARELKKREEFDNEYVCAICYHLYEAGKNLIEEGADRLIYVSESEEEALELPSLSGKRKCLSFKEEKNARIYALNHRKEGAIRVFAGKYRKEGAKDFGSLLAGGKGIKRLGVFRADVDSLGKCFTEGFGEKRDTFTRASVLSRQLSLFFKYFINSVARGDLGGIDRFYLDNKPLEGKPSLAVVYAGGDDLFVAGHWLDVINFAVDLRRAFYRFTAGKMHFSAGLGFFHESYPISEMARLTGELEEKAKGNGKDKDSVALFGASANSVYKWEEFENKVVAKVRKLNSLKLPSAALYRLKALLGGEEKSMNIARLAYTLARAEKLNEEDKREIYGWAGNEKRSFLTALDLVIYLNREVEDDK